MRYVFVFLALSLTVFSPAFAAERSGTPVRSATETSQQRLDKLFTELKRTANERAAARVASRITTEMSRSGSATIDLMMGWSKKAASERRYDVALDFLDQVIVLDPGFADAWHSRATIHFRMKNPAKAMADIEQTLELEPRHFGALSGMAQILGERGNKELALRAWQNVLDVYPMLRNAQNEVGKLADQLTGQSI